MYNDYDWLVRLWNNRPLDLYVPNKKQVHKHPKQYQTDCNQTIR